MNEEERNQAIDAGTDILGAVVDVVVDTATSSDSMGDVAGMAIEVIGGILGALLD